MNMLQWDKVVTELYGDGMPLPNGVAGKIFKNEKGLTITLYDKPKSDSKTKVHIQRSDVDRRLDFVFDEMPKLYHKVCALDEKKTITSRDCEFKSNSVRVLQTHIKNKHMEYVVKE